MNNQEIINKRWKKTEQTLKEYLPKFKKIYTNIQDEVIELLKELNIKRDDLNKVVPLSIKRKLERKKDEWAEKGLLNGYFKYLVTTTTKYTYANVLQLLIYGIYVENQAKEFKYSKEVIVTSANDVYNQAKDEYKNPIRVPDILTWAMISKWLTIPTVNTNFSDYLSLLTQTDVQETYKYAINSINQGVDPSVEDTNKLIQKQLNRVISIKDDKYSGILENACRIASNRAYIEEFEDSKVMFIAEVDDRTTKMCLSLDRQIFNTKSTNIFYRYSDLAQGYIRYEIEGLKEGINMPPIMDHFHWCRSTLTYNYEDYKPNKKYFKKVKDLDLNKVTNPKVNFAKKMIDWQNKTYSKVKDNSNNAGEVENAQWLVDKFGIDVTVMPEANPDGVKNYDYLLDGSKERWDLKANITGNSSRVFQNNITYKQATSYIFDISKTDITKEMAEEMINKEFFNRTYLNTIIVKRGNELIGIYRNINK